MQVHVGAEAIVVCAGCFVRWPTGANAPQNANRAVTSGTRFINAPQNGRRARPSRADLSGQTKLCARRSKKVRLPFMSASLGLRATDERVGDSHILKNGINLQFSVDDRGGR